MNKRVILLFTVLVSLFLVGCTTDDSRTMSGVSDTFNGGDRGLVMEFMEGAPPERIRDGGNQQFQVRILLENLGEYSIEEGEAFVTLLGINPADFNMESNSMDVPFIRGVRKQANSVVEGGRQQVLFSGLSYIPESVGTMPQSIVAELCYPYETRAVIRSCINEDTSVGIEDGTSICDVEGPKEFANSGGPIKIENVQQYATGSSKIEIQFDIVHIPTPDNGRVFRENSIDSSCRINGEGPSSPGASLDRNYVKYSVDSGIEGLDCTGGEATSPTEGFVQLSENRATVFCTQDTQGQGEYERPITVTLSYDYLERISKEILINHISN